MTHMRTNRAPRIDATILGTASLLALAIGGATVEAPVGSTAPPPVTDDGIAAANLAAANLAGSWVSADKEVRLKLGADGRYERSLKGRATSAKGTYRLDGATLRLRDDSGLRTDVLVHDGTLELSGRQLIRG
jgi:putative ligand-binding protein with streptavidin-like fold